MERIKTINSKKLLEEQMKDENFRKEYNNLAEEFEIAKQLIRLRKNQKLTQKQLAELAGTSQPAIARLESCEYKNLTLSFLRRVGKVLGVIPEVHFKKLKKIH
jgi:DNA-directed RNA polymerase specialized sigma subunit